MNPFKKESILKKEIARTVEYMSLSDTNSEDYRMYMDNLERLVRLDREEKTNRVSPDTIAIILGNLFGIVIIVAYERAHVMTSKGLTFLRPINQ